MNNQEAVKALKDELEALENLGIRQKATETIECGLEPPFNILAGLNGIMAMEIAISALEENKQYKELGTIEEVREAMELQDAKKPLTDTLREEGYCSCPKCKRLVKSDSNFCRCCGQKLDWGNDRREIEIYRARIHTGEKKGEHIIRQYATGDVHMSYSEIEIITEYIKGWDGAEVYLMKDYDGKGYLLSGWPAESDPQVKEAIYLMEQDPVFGTYVNAREEFDRVWERGEYEPAGSIGFKNDEVEIIEKLKPIRSGDTTK